MSKKKKKPSDKTFLEKLKEKDNRPTNEHEAEFRERLNKLAGTDDGQYVLTRIMGMCGFQQSSVTVGSDGKIDLQAVQYNEGRRSVYLDIRKRLNVKSKRKIEI